MPVRSILILAAAAAGLGGPAADAQPDTRRISRLLEEANDLLTALEARPVLPADDPDLKRIRVVLDDLTVASPDNPYVGFHKARYMILTGLTGDASIKLFEFVETPQGQSEWRAFRLLGDSLVAEFPRLAKSNYKKADTLNPGQSAVLFGLSICELKLGAIDEAVRLARKAVDADGRNAIRYVAHLARALQAAERWDDALKEAEAALAMAARQAERDPAARRPLETLSIQYALVISILQGRIGALKEVPIPDFLRLDECLLRQNEIRRKLVLHELVVLVESRVQSVEPNVPIEWLKLYGRLLSDVSRTEEAIGVLNRVQEFDPNDAEAKEALRRLRESVTKAP